MFLRKQFLAVFYFLFFNSSVAPQFHILEKDLKEPQYMFLSRLAELNI